MEVQYTNRGFQYLILPNGDKIQQSSGIGEYEDSFSKPGSSFLWIDDEQADREDVRIMLDLGDIDPLAVPFVERWLETGSFA